MALTGRFNFRRSLFGKLVLEVEEEGKPLFGGEKKRSKLRWRRATLLDLAQPQMRALIDLRFQPQFMARAPLRPVDLYHTSERADVVPSAPPSLVRPEPATPQRTNH